MKQHKKVSYGMVQTVKQQQRFVTECYKGSKNITDLLWNGTKGQITSEVCYDVGQKAKPHKRIVTEWRKGSNNIRGLLRSDTNGQRTS